MTENNENTENEKRENAIGAMLEVRKARERLRSEYRVVQNGYKSKLRLLDNTLSGLFDCLDEAEGDQVQIAGLDFQLSPEVKNLLNG